MTKTLKELIQSCKKIKNFMKHHFVGDNDLICYCTLLSITAKENELCEKAKEVVYIPKGQDLVADIPYYRCECNYRVKEFMGCKEKE